MKNSSRRDARRANDVYERMNQNEEILIEGQVPADVMERMK
jgi:hypothetical protein